MTSYDIATRDIEHLEPIVWDRLLFDEAQDAKNPATKRARAMRRLRGARRLALTGTPIENRLGELWAIMDLVNPGLLGSHDRFDRMFARPIEAGHDELRLERLRTMVQPFILRRAKDDEEVALDLPEPHQRRGSSATSPSSRRASTGRRSTAGCHASRSTRIGSGGGARCWRC